MKKTGLIAMALIVGLLVGIAIPAMSASRIDKKQARQIKALKARVAVIENAPDTTTGLADEVNTLKYRVDNHGDSINYFYNATQNLGNTGRYWGNVSRQQVILDENDGCVNGQPKAATWNNSRLSC